MENFHSQSPSQADSAQLPENPQPALESTTGAGIRSPLPTPVGVPIPCESGIRTATSTRTTTTSAPVAIPVPAEGSEQNVSGRALPVSAPDAFRKFAGAEKKEEVRATGADVLALYVNRLEEDISSLKAQIADITNERKDFQMKFHESDKNASALRIKLDWALSLLSAQNTVDWILNFLFAFGSATIGAVVSLSGISCEWRVIGVFVGLVVLGFPVYYKIWLYPKIPRPQ